MTDNKLEALPPAVGQLSHLVELNLSRNQLSSLPGELYGCRELTRLYVARNRITVLPEVGHLSFLLLLFRKTNSVSLTLPSATGDQGLNQAEDSRRGWK